MKRGRSLWWLGSLVAIAVTATMDATGLSMFSALPLLPLTGLFWFLERCSRREMGIARGRWGDYGLALLHPLAVMGPLTVIVFVTGAADTTGTDWAEVGLNLLMSLVGILAVFLTEEGFFRGWLWASLRRAAWSERRVLVGSSVIFMLWHVSPVVLPTGFAPPPAQVPVFLVNATLMGLVWGLLRWRSGSILVASVGHAVWNGLAYGLFGFGREAGALGVEATWLYGPEIGLLGLAFNAAFAWWLWRRTRSST